MKQRQDQNIAEYKGLIQTYHKTLDLMSDVGLSKIDEKLSDARAYVDTIKEIATNKEPILDVGTGVGLPGIVLAIMLDTHTIVLAERRKRRTTFLKIVISKLKLKNVTLFENDVRLLLTPKFPIITAQAVSSFSTLYTLTRQCHDNEIHLLARKGENWQDEINDFEKQLETKIATRVSKQLSSHGSLIALKLPGGIICP